MRLDQAVEEHVANKSGWLLQERLIVELALLQETRGVCQCGHARGREMWAITGKERGTGRREPEGGRETEGEGGIGRHSTCVVSRDTVFHTYPNCPYLSYLTTMSYPDG